MPVNLKIAGSICLLVAAGLVVYSQDKTQTPSYEDIAKMKGNAKYELAKSSSRIIGYGEEIVKQTKGDYDKESKIAGLLGAALTEIATDGSESTQFIAAQLRGFLMERSEAKGAAQVSQIADEANVEINSLIAVQNAQLIEQNKRVIALLEKLAASKK